MDRLIRISVLLVAVMAVIAGHTVDVEIKQMYFRVVAGIMVIIYFQLEILYKLDEVRK